MGFLSDKLNSGEVLNDKMKVGIIRRRTCLLLLFVFAEDGQRAVGAAQDLLAVAAVRSRRWTPRNCQKYYSSSGK